MLRILCIQKCLHIIQKIYTTKHYQVMLWRKMIWVVVMIEVAVLNRIMMKLLNGFRSLQNKGLYGENLI